MLDPAIQAEILRLYFSQNMSRRKIAKLLGIHRITVGNVVARGSVCIEGNKRQKQKTVLSPYFSKIENLLQDDHCRSAVNILQQLRLVGYTGSISSLRCYLQSIRPNPPKQAFSMLTFLPGETAQVDWGEFGDVFGDGTKVHAFVMVLCWSRMLYLEFTQRETLSTLLRCYERALHFFGGHCQEYWHDNMPTVVVERIGSLIRFNTGFLAYCGFRHFKPIACHVNAGHEKGRVEDGVKLVRHQFWPGRHFSDIHDLNSQAIQWRDNFANRREHETTKKIPELMFEKEKQSLLPLNNDSYDTDEITSKKVSKFYRVHFEGNTYSVPWTMVGKTVTLRADDFQVNIFYGPKKVANHQRNYSKNKDIKNPIHEKGLQETKKGAQATWSLEAVKGFGPNTCKYLELITAGTRSLRKEVKELLCLSTVYGINEVEETISSLLEQGIVGVNHVERSLRLSNKIPTAPPPLEFKNERLQFVPPAPQLHSYDELLIVAQRNKGEDSE